MPVAADHLRFRYRRGPWILKGISFSIESGESVAVMGPSGSGKTTLIQIIGGLLAPSSGSMRCTSGANTAPLDPSWVFQASNAFGRRTVRDNVALGLFAHRIRGLEGLQRVDEMIDRLGLAGMEYRPAGSLSGGELQRIGIARALVSEASLILADEPTGQLDSRTTLLVADTLVDARPPASILIVATHDNSVAERCDRQLVVRDGRVCETT